MSHDVSALLSFLEALSQSLEALTALQQQKLTALRSHDLDWLNDCMKQEQALSLSLRSLEQQRTALAADIPLRELSRLCPPDRQAEITALTEHLRRQREVLKSAQNAAYTQAQKELRAVNRALEEQGISPEIAEHYQAAGHSGSLRTDFRA